MPMRASTDDVSTVCNSGTSTRNNECSGRKGMVHTGCVADDGVRSWWQQKRSAAAASCGGGGGGGASRWLFSDPGAMKSRGGVE